MRSPGEIGTVSITGATGFIGGYIARFLNNKGWRLKALVRPGARVDSLPSNNIELVSGSLEDEIALRRLVQGTDAVIHCAGAVRGVSYSDFSKTNVDGVERLVNAVIGEATQPRLLLFSSLAAREPQLSHYAASKRAAEKTIATGLHASAWAAFRPPAVYGPGDRELLPLFQLMAKGIAPRIGNSSARFSVIFVRDLAAATQAWLCSKEPLRTVYELCDGHANGYSWDDVADFIETISGRQARRFRVPDLVLSIPATMNWLAGSVTSYKPMLTPGKLRELRHSDWVCDNQIISKALAWHPQVSFVDGLRDVLAKK